MCVCVFQGFVSFLLPCFAVDHLYLSYDEYLLSEEDTPITEGKPPPAAALISMMRCVHSHMLCAEGKALTLECACTNTAGCPQIRTWAVMSCSWFSVSGS